MRLDATALLWRLRLEGVDVSARFAAVADEWERAIDDGEGGFYAFNDFHAAMAFAAVDRREALSRLRAAMARASNEANVNAEMTRQVGLDVCEAAIAYCEGRYAAAAGKLLTARDGANRFGGSHAQRDVLTLTLIDAAMRAGLPHLAHHYANERLVHKPDSAWGRRLAERIDGWQALRAA